MPRPSILLAILALFAVLAVAACDTGEASEVPGAYTVSAAEAVEMIESGAIDALSVCVSPKFREPILRAAVERGLPIIVEKPWAANGEQAARLAAICAGAKAPIMSAFSFRFHPAVRKAQELLAGPLGRPWVGNGEYVFEWFVPANAWLWDPANGGGVFNENSCHLFDVVCSLMGEPESVFAYGSRAVERPSEIAAAIALRLRAAPDAGGAPAQRGAGPVCAITAGGVGSAARRDYPRLDLYTEHGHLALAGRDHTWQTVEWSLRGDTTLHRLVAPTEGLGRTRYSDAFDHFIDCVLTRRAPDSTVDHGVRSVLIADAIRRSLETGRPEDITARGA